MYGAQNSLGDRLSEKATIPKVNLGAADRALREAHGEKGFQIKGASTRGNVVQVGGLAAGTTAEDVKVCTCMAHCILVFRTGESPPPFPRHRHLNIFRRLDSFTDNRGSYRPFSNAADR